MSPKGVEQPFWETTNIIPFPRSSTAPLAFADKLLLIAAGLHVLGEPATVQELSLLLTGLQSPSLNLSPSALEAALRQCGPDAAQCRQPEIFRAVNLRGECAWAFSPSFRVQLADLGLPISLRSLDRLQPGLGQPAGELG